MGSLRLLHSGDASRRLANVDAQSAARAAPQSPGPLLCLCHHAWDDNGVRANYIFCDGLWLCGRSNEPRPADSREDGSMDRLLDLSARHAHGRRDCALWKGVRALYLLSTAPGQPVVLLRRGTTNRRFDDLGRVDVTQAGCLEARHVRNVGSEGLVRDVWGIIQLMYGGH